MGKFNVRQAEPVPGWVDCNGVIWKTVEEAEAVNRLDSLTRFLTDEWHNGIDPSEVAGLLLLNFHISHKDEPRSSLTDEELVKGLIELSGEFIVGSLETHERLAIFYRKSETDKMLIVPYDRVLIPGDKWLIYAYNKIG